jgi:pyruvate kinase
MESYMKKTKIICTLGPATDDEKILKKLILNGMDVARFNMSHGDYQEHAMRINMIKKIRKELNLPIATLLDTKGPEIRIGKLSKPSVVLETGQKFTLTTNEILGDEQICSVTFKNLPNDIQNGTKIFIDDGMIELKVSKINSDDIICEVINGGLLLPNKGINLPNTELSMPFINQKDRQDIKFAVEQDFDFIAASFTRSAQDIRLLREELNKNNCNNIWVIAKIENAQGVNNIDSIIDIADGIMIARGDLGIEISSEYVPRIQKNLIKRAYNAGKQVITATQMLESMIHNPRPTRAESNDVANAIYDGTSSIMLSGETAAGKYPVESIKTMARIAEITEQDINYKNRFKNRTVEESNDITSAISHATCNTAHDLGAVAIITVSETGRTAKMISKFRPNCPIIGGTTNTKVLRQLNLSWGVIPMKVDEKYSTDELFSHVVQTALEHGFVEKEDIVVITAGIPLGRAGTTNLIKVHTV